MNLFFRVPIQEKILFVKNLSIMTKAGMPILQSLQLLLKQTKSKAMKKILLQLISGVSNGQFLSTSLEEFKNIFGDFTINIIRVGETSGILHENLNYLADELGKNQALRRKIVGVLIYPAILVFNTLAIASMLIIYVFPKILPVFKNFKMNLPISTKILIFISGFLLAYGVYVIAVIVLLIIAVWLLIKIKKVRYSMDYFLLYVPIAGGLSRNYNMANFCRTLGLLLKSDVKVVEAISITADTLTNIVYKTELKNLSQEIASGGQISEHLEKKDYLFPIMLSQLVAIGEKTGNLSETLVYLSEFYETKLDETTTNLSTILEPFLMIVMGAIVAFMAISIITPIYEITQNIR